MQNAPLKNKNEVKKKAIFENQVATGVLGGVAAGAAVSPATFLLRNYIVSKQTSSPLQLKAFLPISGAFTARILARTATKPLAIKALKDNTPELMNNKNAELIATIVTGVVGDVAITPLEKMVYENQTFNANSGKPAPSIKSWLKESSSVYGFVKKCYGFSPTSAILLRSAPFVSSVALAMRELDKNAPKTLSETEKKITVITGAAIFASAVNAAITPVYELQRLTMQHKNPMLINDAVKKIYEAGLKNAYRGGGASAGIGFAGAFATTLAYEFQKMLNKGMPEKFMNNREQKKHVKDLVENTQKTIKNYR